MSGKTNSQKKEKVGRKGKKNDPQVSDTTSFLSNSAMGEGLRRP